MNGASESSGARLHQAAAAAVPSAMMVQSTAPSVDAYLSSAPPQWAAPMRRVRDLAREILKDHDERMHWGRPAYLRGERVEFGFAAQTQYLALYFAVPNLLDRNAGALAGVSHGKGCLRFRKTAVIDWDLLRALLAQTRDHAAA